MDDESQPNCLSSEPHCSNIKDHVTHFLGCVEISDRYSFLNEDSHPVWQREIQHYTSRGDTEEVAKEKTRLKRERWNTDCQSEMRRIDFLRRKMTDDRGDRDLVANLEESSAEWKSSTEYKQNIQSVRDWRASIGREDDYSRVYYVPLTGEGATEEAYDPEKDTNVPFMEFENGKPQEEARGRNPAVWGRFPDQKTTVKSLLDDTTPNNLLCKNHLPDSVKYFHFPSNNMEVSTHSRYNLSCQG